MLHRGVGAGQAQRGSTKTRQVEAANRRPGEGRLRHLGYEAHLLHRQAESHSGDFARVCFHEIAARSIVEEGQLSIEAVNALLDQLAGGRLKQ